MIQSFYRLIALLGIRSMFVNYMASGKSNLSGQGANCSRSGNHRLAPTARIHGFTETGLSEKWTSFNLNVLKLGSQILPTASHFPPNVSTRIPNQLIDETKILKLPWNLVGLSSVPLKLVYYSSCGTRLSGWVSRVHITVVFSLFRVILFWRSRHQPIPLVVSGYR